MTQFQTAMLQAEAGQLQTPSVLIDGGKSIPYFGYQIAVHVFNLKIMAMGMKVRGITFTQIKKYYGLTGRSAKECLPQLLKIQEDYKSLAEKN